MSTTSRARQFLPPETRHVLIELAVAEAGLSNKVEVAFYREIYDSKGFQGVIAEIKRRYPGVRLRLSSAIATTRRLGHGGGASNVTNAGSIAAGMNETRRKTARLPP
jgi:hypothetical protein